MPEILYKEQSFAIVGACFAVYNEMGSGFLESVYQECLEIELRSRGIPYRAHPELSLFYKEQPLERTFRPDFIVFDSIIMEIKAVSEIADEHRAQLHNYLKAAQIRLGMLVNFCAHPNLLWERIVR